MLETINQQTGYYFPLNLSPTSNTTTNFKRWIYLTQVGQSLCIGSEVEHYRRLRSQPANNMGSLFWMFNSIWQTCDWSSIEYGGRWKMLHYAAARFFAAYAVSSYEQPLGHYNVWAVSDSLQPLTGSMQLFIYSYATGKIMRTISVPLKLPVLSSMQVYEADIEQMIQGVCQDRTACFVILQLWDDNNRTVADNHFYLSSLADVQQWLPKAMITIQSVTAGSSPNEALVTLMSSAVAPYTYISTPVVGRFSENGFVLFPAQARTFAFYGMQNFSISYFASSLEVYSISDGF